MFNYIKAGSNSNNNNKEQHNGGQYTILTRRAQQADKPERRQTDGETDTRELRE